jgi:O-antigen/teichoic acid export membrane protein
VRLSLRLPGTRIFASAAVGAWGAALLQFLAGVIVVRSLAPAQVGTFFFGVAIAAFVFGVLDFRIEEGLTQFLVRERNAGRNTMVRAALRYAIAIDLVSGIVIFGVILASLAFLPLHLSRETLAVSAIAALAALIGVSDGSFSAVLYTHQAFGWLSAYQIVSNGARCLALLAFPIRSPADAAWATVAAQFAATAFVAGIVLRRIPHDVQSQGLGASERRWLFRFSVHIALSSAVATVRATATPIVLGAIGTTRQVAAARVAESPTKLLGTVVAPLRTVLFPRLSTAWARRDRAAARRLVRQYLLTTALLAGVLGAALALAMNLVLTRIYGHAYGGLERVGQFFVLAAVLDALAGWQKVAPAALDRPWLRTFILLGESAALLVGLLILVPAHGPLGAALSAALASAVSLAMGAYWLRPVFRERNWAEELPREPQPGGESPAHYPR